MTVLIRWVVLPSVTSALVVIALALACRTFWRVSRPLGVLVAAGLVLRLTSAWVLFWVLYLELPILRSLQFGQGYWRMALDASQYHALALHAAEDGISTLPASTGSRAYVQALVLWIQVVGSSPYSAALLNAVCYLATCALAVAIVRRLPKAAADLAGSTLVGAIAFSPMLVFVSTQPLKDAFFMLFAMMLTAGAWWLAVLLPGRLVPVRHLVPGVVAVVAGILVTAGVRTYYPAFALAGLALLFLVLAFGRPRAPLTRIAAVGAATLGLSIVAMVAGAEDRTTATTMAVALFSPGGPAPEIQRRREGFAGSGGATNVAGAEASLIRERRALEDGRAQPRTRAAPVLDPTPGEQLRAAATGLATLLVPTTLLRALSVVDIQGGSAMLAFGDADTLFFDLSLLATGLVMLRLRRVSSPNLPYLVFAMTMGLLLAGLMGYVVTNVGTIVRLRLMLTVPLWTLPFAFAGPPVADTVADS